MHPQQLLSQLSSCVTTVLAHRAMGLLELVPHGGSTPTSARCRSNSFEAPSANFKANLSARQLSNQNSKLNFASESNKNCLKYTFCLFPYHSIFQGTKKLDSPGFSSFQAQTQCSSNLPHLKSLRVQAFSASFKSRFASSLLTHKTRSHSNTGGSELRPNLVEKMDQFYFLKPVSSFHLNNCELRCTSNAPGAQGAAMRRPRTTSVTSVTASVAAASATAGAGVAWMERSSAETSWEFMKF